VTSEHATAGPERGFTLVEVLVAMLILAVGLLGLEALGIGAARSIARADEQSEFTLVATRLMEGRILEIRQNPAAVATAERCAVDATSGYFACSQVSTRTQLAALPADVARVRVWVRESPDAPGTFDLVSHVYDADLP
jgi:type IV pilus modification protein PilV